MVLTERQGQFIQEQRLCSLATLRKDGSPQNTLVYYLYEDGKFFITSTKPRIKTINIQRDPRVALCVLQEGPPFNYVQVLGTAVVTEEELVERTARIFLRFRPQLPENFPQYLANEQRVLVVVTPERTTERFA
ncbi:MAG: PPOX class F420-dependent oxidoreductase [Dehalococcoidia bacterium]